MRGPLMLISVAVTAWGCGAPGDGAVTQEAPPAPLTATATLLDAAGNEVGRAELTEGEQGVVIAAQLAGVLAGTHAMHLHATGACEPPFDSAGGHAASAGKKHGILSPGGMHEGDLPNIHVPETGILQVDAFAEGATLGAGDTGRLSLFDHDGSAIVLHAGPDDYATDPAGAAGDRIACGVIEP